MRFQIGIGIVLNLVGRSDEALVDTTERVVKACIVCLMPEEQRSDARDMKSARCVPLQQDPAETAEEELVSMTCVVSDQVAGTVVEPRRRQS